jgi:Bax protein
MVNAQIDGDTFSNKTLVLAILLACACSYLLPILHVPSPRMAFMHDDFASRSDISILNNKIGQLTQRRAVDNLTGTEKTALDKELEAATNFLIDQLDTPQQVLPYKQPSTQTLPAFPAELDYDVFDKSQSVPRLFISRMPALDKEDAQRRKQQFIQIMLPLILKVNDEISSHKQAIMMAHNFGREDVLDAFSQKYGLSKLQLSREQRRRSLEMRVQPIPVEIALAQAAVESGWGQSRFTLEGNALFGQWVWDVSKGIKPAQASNSRAAVRSFPDLISSVRSYMSNLNTHHAYEPFRKRRSELHLSGDIAASGLQLVPFLYRYAETGSEYVETLTQMIKQNELHKLASRKLLRSSVS